VGGKTKEMDIAQNRRTGEIVFAKNVHYDNGVYICKNCGVPVVFIRSGYFRPHFKHARGKASEDCEYYSKFYIEQGNVYESLGLELRLSVEDNDWDLNIYLPEFAKNALDIIGLENFYSICFIIDDVAKISSSNLWPGKKGFLCKVKPHVYDYKVNCDNSIPNFSLSDWTRGSKGLNAKGEFFMNPLDGGKRLHSGATIRPGDTVYLIANENKLPVQEKSWPHGIVKKRLTGQQSWYTWEICIPISVSTDIQLWLQKFDYSIRNLGYKMELAWPMPYRKHRDDTAVIDSNNVALNITPLKINAFGVLFHKYGSNIEKCSISGFTKASKMFCFKNIGDGLHSFFIDRFSDNINLFVERKLSYNLGFIDNNIRIKISDQTFDYNPSDPEGIQNIFYNHNNNMHMTLCIIGYEGLNVRVLFEQGFIIKKQLNVKLPVNFENIFSLVDYMPNAIILDFGGFGFFKINIESEKREATNSNDIMNIINLINEAYVVSLQKPSYQIDNSLSGYLELIYRLLLDRFPFSEEICQAKGKIMCLRRQLQLSTKIRPYLINIINNLQR